MKKTFNSGITQQEFLSKFPGGEITNGWLVYSHNLYCDNNQLTSLPENLQVSGGLYPFLNVRIDDVELVNKILQDKLSAKEVFEIENTEHRRIAYEHMDKVKMKELNPEILDEVKDDGYGYPMRLVEIKIGDLTFLYLNCFCPSSGREYFIETDKKTCQEAKVASWGLEEINFKKEW